MIIPPRELSLALAHLPTQEVLFPLQHQTMIGDDWTCWWGSTQSDLLTSFKGHVAYTIWNDVGEPCLGLRVQSRTKNLRRLSVDDTGIGISYDYIETMGLKHLRSTYFHHHNAPLISAFAKRWNPETNNFHLPFGGMTITLHDVIYIMDLNCHGYECINEHFPTDGDVVLLLAEMWGEPKFLVNSAFVKGSMVALDDIFYKLTVDHVEDDESYAWLYMWYLLSYMLFVDNSSNRAPLSVLRLVAYLSNLGDRTLGAMTLSLE